MYAGKRARSTNRARGRGVVTPVAYSERLKASGVRIDTNADSVTNL